MFHAVSGNGISFHYSNVGILMWYNTVRTSDGLIKTEERRLDLYIVVICTHGDDYSSKTHTISHTVVKAHHQSGW